MRVLDVPPSPAGAHIASRYRPRLLLTVAAMLGFKLSAGVSYWAYLKGDWDGSLAAMIGGASAIFVVMGFYRVWQWLRSSAWVVLTADELIAPTSDGRHVAFQRDDLVSASRTIMTHGSWFKTRVYESLTLQFGTGHVVLNKNWLESNDHFYRMCEVFDSEEPDV